MVFLLSSLKNFLLLCFCIILTPYCITFVKTQYHEFLNPQHAVGVIALNGTITTAQPFIKLCHDFFKDSTVKGIIITIESSGGQTGTAQMIFNELESLKKENPKPVVALIENTCTAQAYLIACAAHTIIASGAAIIGQIPHTSDYEEAINDDIYNQVITSIAHKRKLSLKEHVIWGHGQKFTGNQGLKLHLIDKIGSLHDALTTIKEKTLIDGHTKLLYPVAINSPLQRLYHFFFA